MVEAIDRFGIERRGPALETMVVPGHHAFRFRWVALVTTGEQSRRYRPGPLTGHVLVVNPRVRLLHTDP